MKKLICSLFFTIGLLVSCVNEDDISADSIYKDEILDYVSTYKEIVPSGQTDKIGEFINSIDFKRVNIHQLRTTERVIIADLRAMNGFTEFKSLKALFFVNQGKIVRSAIAGFASRTLKNEHDELILSVLNATKPKPNYTGKVSLFNLYRELVLFNTFENGTLDAVGFTRPKKSEKNNGRTDSCTDWFLVTYYPNGNVTSQYVFTTCDNGCEFYRMGRTNCGGGGGAGYASGGGPVLPVNPINGATYEYTDKNGEYTKYQYDAASAIWKIVEKILPAAVVVAKRDEYPFLDLDWPGAYHGQIVRGTDNMVYTFGSDGNWKAEPDDPDLNSDCKSWQYTPIGVYQACGVTGIDFDFTTIYEDANGKTRLEYVYYQFRTIYFEFPHIREDGTIISAGEAAQLTAAAKDLAEEAVEDIFASQPPPLGVTMEQTFLTQLRNFLQPFGGRVTTSPNYGNVPITSYSKTAIGNGNCN